jgi:hypothetical protein
LMWEVNWQPSPFKRFKFRDYFGAGSLGSQITL